MFYLDYSDTSVKVGPRNPRNIQYQSSDELVRLLSPIIDGSKVAVLIPESDIFLHRAHLITPSTDISEVKRLILENAPLQQEEMVFTYKYITQTKEIITYAMNKEVYKTYIDLIISCKAVPYGLIPQSALVYETIKKKISPKDTLLFIDIGSLSSELIVLDYYGPVCTFEEDIHEKNLISNLPRVLTYIKEKYDKEIGHIVLSGGGVHTLQGKQDKFPLPVSLASDYILIPHTYTEDALSYFNIIAMEKSYGALEQLNLLQKESRKSTSFWPQNLLGIIGGIILIGTLIFVLNKEMQLRNQKIISPVSTIISTPTISPTPKPLVLSDISFEILNGSGIEGQAQKVADILKGENITKITTANARDYTYVKTVIRIKEEFSSVGSEIEILLKSQFELEKISILDSSASADVQIIVGR